VIDLDPSAPAFQAAQKACGPLPSSVTPAQEDQEFSKSLKAVACMRANGVPNIPDPKLVGPATDSTIRLPLGDLPGSPAFQRAANKCGAPSAFTGGGPRWMMRTATISSPGRAPWRLAWRPARAGSHRHRVAVVVVVAAVAASAAGVFDGRHGPADCVGGHHYPTSLQRVTQGRATRLDTRAPRSLLAQCTRWL